jgi:hypothetical protein
VVGSSRDKVNEVRVLGRNLEYFACIFLWFPFFFFPFFCYLIPPGGAVHATPPCPLPQP